MDHAFLKILLLITGIFTGSKLFAQRAFDSLKAPLPRHYFNTLISADRYSKPEKEFSDTNNVISRRLKSYGVEQFFIAFSSPLYTSESADTLVRSNTHLLLTGNFLSLKPRFGGLAQDHNLIKAGIGLRYIYNSGKKGIWFIDVSPFVTRDISHPSKPFYRLASTIVYSHNQSLSFNWRVGITKSFMWGNRLYLPFVGLRIGRLDKIYFSIQFPRSLQLSVPLNQNLILSLYSRGQGGMFNFSNHDSLYFRKSEQTFHFSRYEVVSGLRCDVRVGSRFSFFGALGLSTRNSIVFYSEPANPRRRKFNYTSYFFSKKPAPGGFLHLGFVLRLGKTRSYYNNKNLYDAIDLNQGNVQIQPAARQKSVQNLESIQDLIEYNDY